MLSGPTHQTYALDALAHQLMGQALVRIMSGMQLEGPVQRLEVVFDSTNCILPYQLRIVSGSWGQAHVTDLPLAVEPSFYLRHTLWEPMPTGERRWVRLEPPLQKFRKHYQLPEEALSWMDGYELPLAILRMEMILAVRQLPLLMLAHGYEVSPRYEIILRMDEEAVAANGEGYLALIHRVMSQELWREELRAELSHLCYEYPLRQDWLYHLALQPAISSLHMVTEKLGQLHGQTLRQLLRERQLPVTSGSNSPVGRTRGGARQ